MTEDSTDQAGAPNTDEDDELLPLSVVIDMLDDVVIALEQVDDLITAHRRAAGDDAHALVGLHDASFRVGQAWAAVVSARRTLRGNHGQ
jgi:hypothetical protein